MKVLHVRQYKSYKLNGKIFFNEKIFSPEELKQKFDASSFYSPDRKKMYCYLFFNDDSKAKLALHSSHEKGITISSSTKTRADIAKEIKRPKEEGRKEEGKKEEKKKAREEKVKQRKEIKEEKKRQREAKKTEKEEKKRQKELKKKEVRKKKAKSKKANNCQQVRKKHKKADWQYEDFKPYNPQENPEPQQPRKSIRLLSKKEK